MSSPLSKIRHHLYPISAGGKDLSNDTQIRVIGSIQLEIPTKMLRNLNEKLGGKFASTTLGSSMARISCLVDAFLGFLELQSKPSGRPTTAAKREERRKRKSEKIDKQKA